MGSTWELKQKVEEIHTLLERCDAYEKRIAELEAKLGWAQQVVKAQAETSNGIACAGERAAGNGGCGACSWCCSAANATLDALREGLGPILAILLGERSRTEDEMRSIRDGWSILYPQPAALAKEKMNG